MEAAVGALRRVRRSAWRHGPPPGNGARRRHLERPAAVAMRAEPGTSTASFPAAEAPARERVSVERPAGHPVGRLHRVRGDGRKERHSGLRFCARERVSRRGSAPARVPAMPRPTVGWYPDVGHDSGGVVGQPAQGRASEEAGDGRGVRGRDPRAIGQAPGSRHRPATMRVRAGGISTAISAERRPQRAGARARGGPHTGPTGRLRRVPQRGQPSRSAGSSAAFGSLRQPLVGLSRALVGLSLRLASIRRSKG